MDGVMEQSVPHARFVDVAWFWVGDVERVIRRMCVGFCSKLAVERDDVGHQVSLKLQDIFSHFLTRQKLLPRKEEIFDRNDMLVCMSELNPSHTQKSTPPPATFASASKAESCVYSLVSVLPRTSQDTPLLSRNSD